MVDWGCRYERMAVIVLWVHVFLGVVLLLSGEVVSFLLHSTSVPLQLNLTLAHSSCFCFVFFLSPYRTREAPPGAAARLLLTAAEPTDCLVVAGARPTDGPAAAGAHSTNRPPCCCCRAQHAPDRLTDRTIPPGRASGTRQSSPIHQHRYPHLHPHPPPVVVSSTCPTGRLLCTRSRTRHP